MSRNSPQAGLHILVVDDNLVHRRMSQTILVAAGYGVTLAEGGPQALAAFEKAPADVALLDIHMPGMDGFEVCRRLRALPEGKKVPILFLTDVSDLASPDQALLSGGDDFLNKPINRIELLMRVRSLLRVRQQEAILDAMLDGVREPVAVIDGKGQIIKWGHTAARCFGWSTTEALGRSLSSLILPAEQRAEFDDSLQQKSRNGESAAIHHRTPTLAMQKSGRQFPIELHLTPVRTANETAFCVFVRDAGSATASDGG